MGSEVGRRFVTRARPCNSWKSDINFNFFAIGFILSAISPQLMCHELTWWWLMMTRVFISDLPLGSIGRFWLVVAAE